MVQVPVKAAELGVISASPLGSSCKHLIGQDINMLVDMLVWQASGMELDVGVGHTGKIGAHVSAKF